MLQFMELLRLGRNTTILLVICFSSALLLSYLATNSQLIFSYDQARDAYEAQAIIKGDIKVQGPTSDIPGVYHGVLWYYYLAILYALGQNSPEFVAYTTLFLTLLTMPLCVLLSLKLFKDKTAAVVSSILYVFSPLLQAFGRWLSNPVLAIIITPFLLLSLWRYIQKQSRLGALIIGVMMGLLVQSNFAYGVFLLAIPIYFVYFRLKIRVLDIAFFTLGLLGAVSSYLLAEMQFRGKATLSISKFLQESYGSSSNATNGIHILIDRFVDLFYFTVLPLPKFAVFAIILAAFIWFGKKYSKKNKAHQPIIFLTIWIGVLFFFIFFRAGILHSAHIFAPLIMAVAILAGALLAKFKTKVLIPIIVLLVVFQASKSVEWITHRSMPLSIQPDINYYDEKKVVDYTYQAAGGEPFTITTITNPLEINTTWSYLYEYYGKQKYGYVPYFHGKSQVGYLGNLPEKQFATDTRFLIVEPSEGIEEIFIVRAKYDEDIVSDVIEDKSFGKFTVQRRDFHPNKPPIATPSAILKQLIDEQFRIDHPE